jgi:hypothetical protein
MLMASGSCLQYAHMLRAICGLCNAKELEFFMCFKLSPALLHDIGAVACVHLSAGTCDSAA